MAKTRPPPAALPPPASTSTYKTAFVAAQRLHVLLCGMLALRFLQFCRRDVTILRTFLFPWRQTNALKCGSAWLMEEELFFCWFLFILHQNSLLEKTVAIKGLQKRVLSLWQHCNTNRHVLILHFDRTIII